MTKKIDIDLLREFKIRVYGILPNKGKFLVSYENFKGKEFVKFPGGGLELGESTLDCLKREFKEELNINIEIGKHIYTAESVVQNSFESTQQVIGIYYFVSTSREGLSIIDSSINAALKDDHSVLQKRAWLPKEALTTMLTFDMDIEAAKRL